MNYPALIRLWRLEGEACLIQQKPKGAGCYRLLTIEIQKNSPASVSREIIARQLLVVWRSFLLTTDY